MLSCDSLLNRGGGSGRSCWKRSWPQLQSSVFSCSIVKRRRNFSLLNFWWIFIFFPFQLLKLEQFRCCCCYLPLFWIESNAKLTKREKKLSLTAKMSTTWSRIYQQILCTKFNSLCSLKTCRPWHHHVHHTVLSHVCCNTYLFVAAGAFFYAVLVCLNAKYNCIYCKIRRDFTVGQGRDKQINTGP